MSAIRGSSRSKAAASPKRSSIIFVQSEQIPSLVRVAVDDSGRVAGGILLQHLPEGEEGRERLHTRLDHPEWEHVRFIGETIRPASLPIRRCRSRRCSGACSTRRTRCACSRRRRSPGAAAAALDYVRGVIGRFTPEEQADMVDAEGFISVDCEFCSRVFPIRLDDLRA